MFGFGTGSSHLKVDKAKSFTDLIRRFTNVYWFTTFTHEGDDLITGRNYSSLMSELCDTDVPFPEEVLIDTRRTLNYQLKIILNNNNINDE